MPEPGRLTLSAYQVKRLLQLCQLIDSAPHHNTHWTAQIRAMLLSKEERAKWTNRGLGKSSPKPQTQRSVTLLPPSSLVSSGKSKRNAKRIADQLASMLTS